MTGPEAPAAPESSPQAPPRREPSRLWLLALLPLLLLGQPHSLWGADEPREAEIAREMYASGDWVVPRLNGQPFLEKPPLAHWGAAMVYALAGGPSERWCRLPSAFWALLGALAAYWLAAMLAGRRAGLLAALVLATCWTWFEYAHLLLVDVPLAAGAAWALAFFWWGYSSGESWSRRKVVGYALSAAAAGVAFLAKGPIGVALPGIGALAFLLWRRQWREILRALAPWNLAAFALVAAPWLAALWVRGGRDFFKVVFWDNMVLRFVSGRADHAAPPWYYLGKVFEALAPWSLLGLPVVWTLAAPSAAAVPEARRRRQFLAAATLAPLALLSAASGKRTGYLLPVMPAMAAAIGAWLAGALGGREPRWAALWRAVAARVLPVLVVLVAAAMLLPPVWGRMDAERGHGALVEALRSEVPAGARLVGFGLGEREVALAAFHRGQTFLVLDSGDEDAAMLLRQELAKPDTVVLARKHRLPPADARVRTQYEVLREVESKGRRYAFLRARGD